MKRNIWLFILLLFLAPGILNAQDVGETAPDFSHQTLEHGTINLSDYEGRVVYLFFFGWG